MEKGRKCAECGDSSGRKFALALPLFVDKPHQCKERGKSFIKIGELKKHLRYSLEKGAYTQNAINQVAIIIISSDTKSNIQKQLTRCCFC